MTDNTEDLRNLVQKWVYGDTAPISINDLPAGFARGSAEECGAAARILNEYMRRLREYYASPSTPNPPIWIAERLRDTLRETALVKAINRDAQCNESRALEVFESLDAVQIGVALELLYAVCDDMTNIFGIRSSALGEYRRPITSLATRVHMQAELDMKEADDAAE